MAFRSEPFDATRLPLLVSFDCRKNSSDTDIHGKLATDWIKCVDPNDSPLGPIPDPHNVGLVTETFLYFDDDLLVGFGSVGTTTRTVKREVQIWSIIPHIGVDHRFCKNSVDWKQRYSALIMVHLIGHARAYNTPRLLLYVHINNPAARKLYDRLAFSALGGPNKKDLQPMYIDMPQPNICGSIAAS